MDISISLLFLFASIGVINGILVGLYLMIIKRKTPQLLYLGALLIALSIRIGKSVFHYFDHTVDRLILQIGLSACILIGPLFHLYVRTSVNHENTFKKNDLIRLTLIGGSIILGGIIFPYRQNPDIWNGYFIYYIYGIWSTYVILGIYFASKEIISTFQSEGLEQLLKSHLFVVSFALLFITITFQSALYISGFTYIWGAVGFTIFFYYMMVNVILNKGDIEHKTKNTEPIADADRLLEKIKSKMEGERLFLNPKLKLNELADEVGLNRNTLSRLLNEEYAHGFSNFVNEMRVEEAKKLIHLRPELSLEGIGYEAGFNSKSSFFATFKKCTGYTPAQFKKNMQTI